MRLKERGNTLFLKVAIFFMGIVVLALCIFWLPWVANDLAVKNVEFAYLKYPLLIGIEVTLIPYLFALYQGFKLLSYIDKNNAFTHKSVQSLTIIKYCAAIISAWYVIGFFFVISQNAGNPGVLLIALVIIFACFVVSVFAAVLQKLLKNAIAIQEENDLTV
ncbi:DUF2975 domain-containing protein [Fredinandcohnia sp. QZ13]|uniref:DUF2975 domain-containing protein n=1 Tax=Fredinandcohnia sp. QZ13 TaxID=3073144 RepID=UPI0028535351|nr:DUF2975 domain-containing protein [Fredinandcohnia sp. QZ13]MDR4887922.1 DUF2975 domain-containing protein [Fredinandcohnia sp. QZ13]